MSASSRPDPVARGGWLGPAARIVYDVVLFRVRRLEMANFAGAVSIMFALRIGLGEALYRSAFAALLNVLVYLNNDYHDVTIDADAPDKDAAKGRFLRGHLSAALRAQWALTAVLCALALVHSRGLLLVLVVGGGVCWLYSLRLKHTPGLDVAAMAVWGVVMPLCGSPLDRTLGLLLALQLGLFSAVFETLQVVRDRRSDAALGIATTAVVLGGRRTVWLARGLMLVCAGYAVAVLHPVCGALALGALVLPMRDAEGDAGRVWTRVKVIYGSAWLVACGYVYAQGHSGGLLLKLDVASVLQSLAPLR